MEVTVHTYSGYKADEYPLSVQIGDQCLSIIDIEDRWYSPDYSYFKIFTDNAKRYILKQCHKNRIWDIEEVKNHTENI